MSKLMLLCRGAICAALLTALAVVSMVGQDGRRGARRAEAIVAPESKMPEVVNTGVLQTSDPTYNRTGTACNNLASSPNGSAVHYDTYQFTAPTSGSITISLEIADGGFMNPQGSSTNGADTYMALYNSGGFNPAAAMTNCIAVNDDLSGTIHRSKIVTSLPSAGTYTVVLTSFTNTPVAGVNDDPFPWSYALSVRGAAAPILFGPTDFVVADANNNQVNVYDQNLAFKGTLDALASFNTGLDAIQQFYVVSCHRTTNTIRVYNRNGTVVSSVSNAANINSSSQDLKFRNGRYYTLGSTGRVNELDPAGNILRTFGTANNNLTYYALFGTTMWAGNGSATIWVFDLNAAGTTNIPESSTFSVNNNGQFSASTLTYSPGTNTVLMTENGANVWERTTAGAFVRKYDMTTVPLVNAQAYQANLGVTRGPSGDVFVTAYHGGGDARIIRFNGTTGAFISSTNVETHQSTPVNIIWIGNAATAAGVTVSGRVLAPSGLGVRSSAVTLTGPDGETQTVWTTAGGQFQFIDVEAGKSYSIGVFSRRFNFSPQIVNVTDNVTGLELFADH